MPQTSRAVETTWKMPSETRPQPEVLLVVEVVPVEQLVQNDFVKRAGDADADCRGCEHLTPTHSAL